MTHKISNLYKWFWGVCLLIIFCAFLLVTWRLEDPVFPNQYSKVIWSQKGELLSARVAQDGQWRFPQTPNQKDSFAISSKFETALLEFEDQNFYQHFGFDIPAIFRALYLNITQKEVVSGASTLSMQVIRMKERAWGHPSKRSYFNKFKEFLQAIQLELKYSKKQILNLYAHHAPFGGNVVGLNAASWRFFGHSQKNLSWAQAAMLAVLPNNPSQLNLNSKRHLLQAKRNRLLERLFHKGSMTKDQYQLALEEEMPYQLQSFHDITPHLIYCANCPNQTIDKELQIKVNTLASKHIDYHKQNLIHNVAVLILDTQTGEPRAYLGNSSGTSQRNFDLNKSMNSADNSAYVDMIQAFRSPGSTLKPFLYASALERGIILPTSLLPDYPSRFGSYRPLNFNEKYEGAVPAWKALAHSLNIPAIHLLQQVGVGPFQEDLNLWGFEHMQNQNRYYGLTLALGGAETSLWELTHAYRNLYLSSSATKDSTKTNYPVSPQAAELVIEAMKKVNRPEDERTWQMLGVETPIAYKTGTSWGFRDAWSIGISPRYIVGVWVGNATSEGRPGLTGTKVAAPILFQIMKHTINYGNYHPSAPEAPETLETLEGWAQNPFDHQVLLCDISGYLASKDCPSHMAPALAKSQQMKKCPYHHKVQVNSSGQRTHSQCGDFIQAKDTVIFELPPKMSHYFQETQMQPVLKWSPQCPVQNTPFEITYPDPASKIIIPKLAKGQTKGIYFEAQHHNPQETLYWFIEDKYMGNTTEIHQIEVKLPPGQYTLAVQDSYGAMIQRKFNIVSSQ